VPEADSIEVASVSPDADTPVSASTMLVVELVYNVKTSQTAPTSSSHSSIPCTAR
jgi:hypothetical protein